MFKNILQIKLSSNLSRGLNFGEYYIINQNNTTSLLNITPDVFLLSKANFNLSETYKPPIRDMKEIKRFIKFIGQT